MLVSLCCSTSPIFHALTPFELSQMGPQFTKDYFVGVVEAEMIDPTIKSMRVVYDG